MLHDKKNNFLHFYLDESKIRLFCEIQALCMLGLRVLERGSRGPSTVTLIALEYVATCVGEPATEIVNVKLFPVINEKIKYFNILRGCPISMLNFDIYRTLASTRSSNES